MIIQRSPGPMGQRFSILIDPDHRGVVYEGDEPQEVPNTQFWRQKIAEGYLVEVQPEKTTTSAEAEPSAVDGGAAEGAEEPSAPAEGPPAESSTTDGSEPAPPAEEETPSTGSRRNRRGRR